MKYTIKNDDIRELNGSENVDFPKYTTQLINIASQTAQGTRPNVVGQLSDLFPEYLGEEENISVESWTKWYLERHPESMNAATDRIYNLVEKLKVAIQLIDRDMIEKWVKDLVIDKTYNGLYFQQAILMDLAKKKNMPFQSSTAEDESKGIDGYVGGIPYSVKPVSYKSMGHLSEEINVKLIYYKKTKTGLSIEVED